MTGNDTPDCAFRPRPHDLVTAFGLLTRLPLPMQTFDPAETRPAAYAAWAYPLVGVVVALACAVVCWASLSVGFPPMVAALFVLLASTLLTGAMHEDGLADCADGFWGGWTRERRLNIMKDSQIGTYGVIALFISLGLRLIAIAALISADVVVGALVGAAVASRAVMVWMMFALPSARKSGLSDKTGRPPFAATALALGIGALTALATLPAPFLLVVCVAIASALATRIIAKRKIGGQTGDVLGATQQLTEIAVLLTCLAAL